MSPAERRQQIISLAAGLFDQSGYSSTTMDDIAREVGVAKPTLYHYFPSKDDILHAIHEEFIDLLMSRHERALRRPACAPSSCSWRRWPTSSS